MEKNLLRSPNSTIPPELPSPPLTHIPKCPIHRAFHFQPCPVMLLHIWQLPKTLSLCCRSHPAWQELLPPFSNLETPLVASASVTADASRDVPRTAFGNLQGGMSIQGCRRPHLHPGPSLKVRHREGTWECHLVIVEGAANRHLIAAF